MIDDISKENKNHLSTINDLRYHNAQMLSKVQMSAVFKQLDRRFMFKPREKVIGSQIREN